MKENILRDKSKRFALRIIKLYKYLKDSKNEYIMSKQLIRCGTGIGANISEATFGQSEADFICKLSIAQKETSETLYWLELLSESGYIDEVQFQSIYTDATELMKLLTASIKTVKAKLITNN